MAKKISTAEFAEGLNNEGIDYAINYYYDAGDLQDKMLAQLVNAAKDASSAILDYLNKEVPGWDGISDEEIESTWNSEEEVEEDAEPVNYGIVEI